MHVRERTLTIIKPLARLTAGVARLKLLEHRAQASAGKHLRTRGTAVPLAPAAPRRGRVGRCARARPGALARTFQPASFHSVPANGQWDRVFGNIMQSLSLGVRCKVAFKRGSTQHPRNGPPDLKRPFDQGQSMRLV